MLFKNMKSLLRFINNRLSLVLILIVISGICYLFKVNTTIDIYFLQENKYKGRYVCTQLHGRLGNLLFQYASAEGIARRNNKIAIYDGRMHMAKGLNLKYSEYTLNVDKFLGKKTYAFVEHNRRAGTYDPETQRLPRHLDVRLIGYYQSWRYFTNIEADLRREFACSTNLKIRVHRYFTNMTPNDWRNATLIGVHGRRGDMTNSKNVGMGYATPGRDYYTAAMQAYRRVVRGNIIFIVASDNLKWIKNNIIMNRDDVKIVYNSKFNTPLFDLCILSACKHMIISSGTFSWWAGWLANGEVIYFNGFPNSFSWLAYMYTKSDYYLPQWIPLDDELFGLDYAINRLKFRNLTDYDIETKKMNH